MKRAYRVISGVKGRLGEMTARHEGAAHKFGIP